MSTQNVMPFVKVSRSKELLFIQSHRSLCLLILDYSLLSKLAFAMTCNVSSYFSGQQLACHKRKKTRSTYAWLAFADSKSSATSASFSIQFLSHSRISIHLTTLTLWAHSPEHRTSTCNSSWLLPSPDIPILLSSDYMLCWDIFQQETLIASLLETLFQNWRLVSSGKSRVRNFHYY